MCNVFIAIKFLQKCNTLKFKALTLFNVYNSALRALNTGAQKLSIYIDSISMAAATAHVNITHAACRCTAPASTARGTRQLHTQHVDAHCTAPAPAATARGIVNYTHSMWMHSTSSYRNSICNTIPCRNLTREKALRATAPKLKASNFVLPNMLQYFKK